MPKIQFLEYTVYLNDKDLVATIQAANPGNAAQGRFAMSPAAAALLYSAPIQLESAAFDAPCIRSKWFTTEFNFPTAPKKFTRKSGGWFGISLLFGTTTTYYWIGRAEYSADASVSAVAGEATVAMAQALFIDGFEFPFFGSPGSSGNSSMTRVASRHADGYGLSIGGSSGTRVHQYTTPVATGGAIASPTEVWSRFYFRRRRNALASANIWRNRGNPSSNCGVIIHETATGKLSITVSDNVNTLILKDTSSATYDLFKWYRVDILSKVGLAGYCKVYVNRALVFNVANDNSGYGMGSQTSLQSEEIGGYSGDQSTDIDDWIGRRFPTGGVGIGSLPGHDWNYGTRIKAIRPTGLGASHLNWTGDYRNLLTAASTDVDVALTSIVASARLDVVTDGAREIDTVAGALGYNSLQVSKYGTRGANSGTLGFRKGGVDTLAAITDAAGAGWTNVLYNPTGIIQPVTPLGALELVHVKGADVTIASTWILGAEVELVGIFGEEDLVAESGDPALTAPAKPIYMHNAPYPRTPWAVRGVPPISPYAVIGGTYVGNGTGQDITFDFPPCFIWIRPLTGSNTSVRWFSSGVAAHRQGQDNVRGFLVSRLEVDPSYAGATAEDVKELRYVMRLAGASADNNANTVVYQYIAICDPGMRFFLAGGLVGLSTTADVTTPLEATSFTPEAVILQKETYNSGGTNEAFYYKGPGHAANAVSPSTAAEIATGLAVAAGQLISKTAFHPNTSLQEIAFLCCRRTDGNSDPNQVKVLQLASYTGDGTASRTISLPTTGLRPMFALIVGHNGTSVWRDPSHTGTTSTQLAAGANASTGITGGAVDSISVGSLLNTNAVVFDVFVLPGSATAGNGGFSVNGQFTPVEPDSPVDAGWDGSPEDPEAPEDEDDGEPETGGDATDFGTQCIAASTKVINQALSRLGITKQIGDVTTELSQEAESARLHYSDDVSAVLRDFPWPFATRYADLVVVDGSSDTPVNGDWTFSYRAPTNMMFARRILNPAHISRDWDPDPITFRVGGDDTGGLVYTALEDATLEYTIRPDCAASAGDALFRSALAWRHAHSLAPALARDTKKQDYCWSMYERVLAQAATAAANEVQQDKPGDPDWIEFR